MSDHPETPPPSDFELAEAVRAASRAFVTAVNCAQERGLRVDFDLHFSETMGGHRCAYANLKIWRPL